MRALQPKFDLITGKLSYESGWLNFLVKFEQDVRILSVYVESEEVSGPGGGEGSRDG